MGMEVLAMKVVAPLPEWNVRGWSYAQRQDDGQLHPGADLNVGWGDEDLGRDVVAWAEGDRGGERAGRRSVYADGGAGRAAGRIERGPGGGGGAAGGPGFQLSVEDGV